MKICPKCDSPIENDAASQCPYCYYSFVETKPDFDGSVDLGSDSTEVPAANKKKSNAALWIVLAVVLAVVIIGAAVAVAVGMGLTKTDSDSDTGNNAAASVAATPEPSVNPIQKGDLSALDDANEILDNARESFNAGNYSEDSIPQCEEAIQDFVNVAEANGIQDQVADSITETFAIYQSSIIIACNNLYSQGTLEGGYAQCESYIDRGLATVQLLENAGYSVDYTALADYQSGLVGKYRDLYINAINDITNREQWSRDEAWNYAEQAYNITDDNGAQVLFSMDDLDDPLRMRYAYCEALVTTKRCETGIADGSLSYADAVQNMVNILQETDYNPVLLEKIIEYGQKAGMDVSNYQKAYNAIINEIWNEEGINIGSDVDLGHFWYFNDLDGDDKYKVGGYGTTAAVRNWIRSYVATLV